MKCPIPGYKFSPFASWYGVRHAAKNRVSLFYKAPLDPAPRPVFVVKAFKNGKIRLTSGEVTFTADAGHTDRFLWLEREAPEVKPERHPLIIKRAIVRSGSFVGCEPEALASSLDMADAEATARALSLQEPGSIFGYFAEESAGWRNLGWLRNGERI